MSRRKKPVMDEIKRESLAEMMHRTNQPSEFDNKTPEGSGSRKHRTTPDPKPPAAARDGVADAPPVSGAADAVPGAPADMLSPAVNDPIAASRVDEVHVTNLRCPQPPTHSPSPVGSCSNALVTFLCLSRSCRRSQPSRTTLLLRSRVPPQPCFLLR